MKSQSILLRTAILTIIIAFSAMDLAAQNKQNINSYNAETFQAKNETDFFSLKEKHYKSYYQQNEESTEKRESQPIVSKYHPNAIENSNNRETTVEVTIEVAVDYWYYEASWNIYDVSSGNYYYGTDKTFSEAYEAYTQTADLSEGDYEIHCWDSYGDGGITGTVLISSVAIMNWDNDDYDSYGSFAFFVSTYPHPLNLTANKVNENDVQLEWEANDYEVEPDGYKVFRNGNEIATTDHLNYLDENLTMGKYDYYVKAFNLASNRESNPSNMQTIIFHGETIEIPDVNFRVVINEHVGYSYPETENHDPTEYEMSTIDYIYAYNKGINDIDGAQYLINAYEIRLGNSNILEISPLAELTGLLTLILEDNLINDISHLSGLTNLEYLSVSNNNISDINALSGMSNLVTFSGNNNSIDDLTPISTLTQLERLFLANNLIQDISILASFNQLYVLDLSYNPINEFGIISQLTNLSYLQLRNTGIQSIDFLSQLNSLNSLYLNDNSIVNIFPLSDLVNLYSLDLSDNNIYNLHALSYLINIQYLNLGSNIISDIHPLVLNPGLGNYQWDNLYLNDNPLSKEAITNHIPILESRTFNKLQYSNNFYPYAPCYPDPSRAENISTTDEASLNWEIFPPRNGEATFNVYNGTTPENMSLVYEGLTDSQCQMGINSSGNYWRVETNTEDEVLYGGVWYFDGAIKISQVTTQDPLCFEDLNGEIIIEAEGVYPELQYSINGGGTWKSNNNFEGLSGGDYYISVKDAEGNEMPYDNNPVTLVEPDPIIISNITTQPVTCFNASNGEIEIDADGGFGDLQYSIDDRDNWFAGDYFLNLDAGNYNIHVKDENGCIKEYANNPVVLQNPLELVFSLVDLQHSTCFGASDGIIEIIATGGTGEIQYSIDEGLTWQSDGVFEALSSGSYQLLVKDENECYTAYESNPVELLDPPQLTIQEVVTTDISCFGASDGSITITASGGTGELMYSIDEGATWEAGPIFTDLAPGDYQLQVKDENECTLIYSANPVTFSEPAELIITSVDAEDASGFEAGDGSIEINAEGGTGTLEYSINDGLTWQSGSVFTLLEPGAYHVQVKDENGCTTIYGENPVLINEPAPLIIEGVEYEHITGCYGNENGSIVITAQSVGSTIFYSIDGGETWHENEGNFEDLPAGDYNVQVKDDLENLVQYADNPVTLTQPEELLVTQVNSTNITCYEAADGTIEILVSGGSGELQYSVNDGVNWQDTPVFEALLPGDYMVYVKDENECMTEFSGNPVSVTEPDELVINEVISNDASGYYNQDGSIVITSVGGTGQHHYSINAGTTWEMEGEFLQLPVGDYNVQIKDDSECMTAHVNNPVTVSWPNEENTLVGQVKYFNANETPMPLDAGLQVALVDGLGNLSQQQSVGVHPEDPMVSSYYAFTQIEPGQSYTVRIWEEGASLGDTWMYENWNGVSSADALIISYMVSNNPIIPENFPWIQPVPSGDYTDLFLYVADVNSSASLTGVDPLTVIYRSIGFPGTSPFPNNTFNHQVGGNEASVLEEMVYPEAPQVVFEPSGTFAEDTPAEEVYYEASVGVEQGENVFNIYYVTTGDVNASNIPQQGEAKQTIQLAYQDQVIGNVGEQIILPVKTKTRIEVGAFNLGLSYDNDLIRIDDAVNYDIKHINHEKGFARVAMTSNEGRIFEADETIVNLKVSILKALSSDGKHMQLESLTEFVDVTTRPITDMSLYVPMLKDGNLTSIDEVQSIEVSHKSYPNPFKEATNIQYTLPEAGTVTIRVYDNLGRVVKTLAANQQMAGEHQVEFTKTDAEGPGLYTYTISVDGINKNYIARGSLILL